MGRMFEALREADARLDTVESQRLALLREPAAETPDEPVEAEEEAESAEDAPFIEVGPNRSVEASPGILDRPPAARPRPAVPLADEEPILATADEETPHVLPVPAPRPMTISFRPPLGVEKHSPRPRFAPDLIAYHCPEHPASARYGALLATLTSTVPDRSPAFLFTSAALDADTATVVLNLAITTTRKERRRVIVVDANTARPCLAARLGIPETPGLCDVLKGTATPAEAVQETEQINLFALTAGSGADDGGLRLVARTMRSLVRELRKQFDLVLVNGPRWDGRPEVVAAGLACDAVYVVVPETDAESAQADDVLQTIPRHGVHLGGCVLTSAD